MKFATLLIHSGSEIDAAYGALATPIVQATTYDRSPIFMKQMGIDSDIPYSRADSPLRNAFEYSRSENPTRAALETTAAALEGGSNAYAFASGIAAISSVLGIFQAGDHIIGSDDIYGGTYRILKTFFKRWGLEYTALEAVTPQAVKAAIKPNTKAIYMESPSNPLLKITDIKAVCDVAKEAGLITIIDNTFMTPLLQRPIELGVDIVVHSATKFLGGHSDVLAGIVITKTEALGKRVYQVQNGFGAVLGPMDCFLLIRGIKTLKVRLEAEQATAQKIALFLNEHKNVESVYYPGLQNHPMRDIHFNQADGAGAVLSFKTKTESQAIKFLARTKLAASAVSLGSVETIASYPVSMSHAAIPKSERDHLGITNTLIRISAGLEDEADLIADFDEALS
ncbi:MAG: PLP-dependent aspartate aminotransferase family protein [Termitinemataceae bacterium]|nr:MAG: PLP-dependent aspartate aminotransferase family protein [Termitinemataceae bacterium]